MAGRERGFSLIETLVSLLILFVVVLSGVSVLSLSAKQNRLAADRTTATSLTVERIQQITSMPFRDASRYQDYLLPGEVAAAGPPPTLTADYGDIPGYPRYRRVVTLDYGVPVTGMLRIVSEVSW